MIIGVALIVDELHKGHRLVFRYPEATPSFALFAGELMLHFHEEYLSLSPDDFARLFKPKPAFFNKVLELTIGDISYISYPTPCGAGNETRGEAEFRDSLGSDINNTAVGGEGDGSTANSSSITMFNVVIARVREGAMKLHKYGSSAELSQEVLGTPGVDPIAALMGLSGTSLPVSPQALRK